MLVTVRILHKLDYLNLIPSVVGNCSVNNKLTGINFELVLTLNIFNIMYQFCLITITELSDEIMILAPFWNSGDTTASTDLDIHSGGHRAAPAPSNDQPARRRHLATSVRITARTGS